MNLTKAHPETGLPLTIRTQNRLKILHGGTIASLVDLGGSLAVASKGHYATGVSTDLTGESGVLLGKRGGSLSNPANTPPTVSYLSSGGKVGDKLRCTAVCDKSKRRPPSPKL